jgi:protein-S-isoprenylcysteine O-methyltransferase Ste14
MALRDELARSGAHLFRWRSYLPLLFLPVILLALVNFTYIGGSERLDDLWDSFCLGVAALGLTLRVLTVGYVPRHTSGRNTREQKAATLNTTGMYSVVRHPLYLGNFLIWLGIALFAHTWWLLMVTVLAFWIYYERIMLAEEEFLRTRFGVEFEEWAARTPAIIPAFRHWRTPALPFSWKSVLARENSTLLATVVVFFTLEVAGDFFAGKLTHIDLGWEFLLSASCTIYVVLRWMKTRRMLSIDGR